MLPLCLYMYSKKEIHKNESINTICKLLNNDHNTKSIQLGDILNHFYHCLSFHDDETDFNFIFNRLKDINECDIQTCNIYSRDLVLFCVDNNRIDIR